MMVEAIDPTGFLEVSQAEFAADFASFQPRIERGLIVKVSGSEALSKIDREMIAPAAASGDMNFFRENPDPLHRTQLLQRALFQPLAKGEQDLFVESYTRLRLTNQMGVYAGPHIDADEGLPPNGLNFWTCFTDLEGTQAIQFYPRSWRPSHNHSGTAYPGVWRDSNLRLHPTDALTRDAMSIPVRRGEYLVFNSGRIVHSSPFRAAYPRISCDLRLVPIHGPESLMFQLRRHYYDRAHIDRFDGEAPVADVLQSLWSVYAARMRDAAPAYGRPGDEDPLTTLLLNLEAGREPDPKWILRALDDEPVSVQLRSTLLRTKNLEPALLERVLREFWALPPRSPWKVYAEIMDRVGLVPSLHSLQRVAVETSGGARTAAVMLYLALWALRRSGAASSAKSSLVKRLSLLLMRQVAPGERGAHA